MNSEYIYKDGKVLIIDDTDKDTSTNYYDNLDEVLIKENLIENMYNDIEYLENELETFNLDKEIKHMKRSGLGIFLISIVAPFLGLSFMTFVGEMMEGYALVEALKNALIVGGVVEGISILPMTVLGGILSYTDYKSSKNEISKKLGKVSQLDFLKKTLKKEKDNIKVLKKDLTNTKKNNDFERVKVDDKEAFKELDNWLKIAYDLGYNVEKYYKYLTKGTLDSKLDNYTKEELEVVKKYLEERGPVLTKRKKN